jgi:hypothetical protein
MGQKKAARPRAARKKRQFVEIPPSEWHRALPPKFRALKPDDKVLVLLRWADPVDPNCELVNAAIDIIQPPKEKEASCREHVARTIQLNRMTPKKERFDAGMLQKLRLASLKVAEQLADLPTSLQDGLRSVDFDFSAPIVELGHQRTISSVAGPQSAASRYERLRVELDSLAEDVGEFFLINKFDWVKFNVAQTAYFTLVQFAEVRPTTTAAGPFYELASLYYEATTGLREVSMERQCRKFLASGLQR